MEERVIGRIPLGRLGDAATDIGVAVRFLLGDDAPLRDRPHADGRRRQLPTVGAVDALRAGQARP